MMSSDFKTLTIQHPFTVRTVNIDIPDEEWFSVTCNFSVNKDFTFLAACLRQGGGVIYLKPDIIYPSREWETIFDFKHGSIDFDKNRTVMIKTYATLS